jgi:hypothetical protein
MIKSPNRRIGPLLGLSAGLGGVIALELAAGPFFVPDDPQASPSVQGTPEKSIRPAETPEISTFNEVFTRPLFTPSRRPQSTESDVTTAANQPKHETFDLIGVMISAERRMALLRARATSAVLLVIEGQSIAGWEVRAIQPTLVVLGHGDDSEVIKMSDPGNSPSASNPSRSSKTTLPAQETPETP